MNELQTIAVVILALTGDALFGDPPNRFHPVAWTGRAISLFQCATSFRGEPLRFLSGLLLISLGTVVVALVGWLLQWVFQQCPLVVAVVAQAVVLMCTFSVRSLASAATCVAAALRSDDLPSARQQVAWHLVSRDVSASNASQLSAATIESVAENTSDSVIAPLFYFAVAGLPGVFVYRFVNTCDAMIGYRTEELEWYGKPAARLDDLLNLIPARLTAVLMLLCAFLFERRGASAVTVWWRDHRRTASPNAGHPMSAASGVLGVALAKDGHYLLGGEQPEPAGDDVERAVTLLWGTTASFILLLSTALLLGAIE